TPNSDVPGDDSTEESWKPSGRGSDLVQTGNEQPAATEGGAGSAGRLERGEVAAVVNGQPIFYDDVLVRATPQLKQAKAQLSPAEYRKFRRMVAEKYLDPHIERELLLQGLRRKMKPEQFEGLQKALNKQVDEDLKKTMSQMGVSTLGELEIELRKSDLTVETLRTMIRNQKMSEQFLASKAYPRDGFDRPDLVAWYQSHPEDYKVEGRVRWQQVQLPFAKHGGPAKTEELARQISQQLAAGTPSPSLSLKHSTGPTAESGGVRDWTTEGSLAAEEVNEALFSLPVGSTSDPIRLKDACWIVKVLDRDDAHLKPFEEVQNQIKEDLRKQRFSGAVKEIMQELRDQADIVLFPEDGDR
ncbi:MAG: peptidylprolyl isomerase, partial [Planctomycetaceae bacterium]